MQPEPSGKTQLFAFDQIQSRGRLVDGFVVQELRFGQILLFVGGIPPLQQPVYPWLAEREDHARSQVEHQEDERHLPVDSG